MRVGPYDEEVANLALMRKDFRFLFKYCEEEIGRNPYNWQPHSKLATVHSLLFIVDKKSNHIEKSIEFYKKALTLLGNRFPRSKIIYGLGMNYERLGRFDLAKTAFMEAEEELYFQEEARVHLLDIALKERDRPEAERLFNLLPDDFEGYYRFGLPYIDKAALRKLIDETFK